LNPQLTVWPVVTVASRYNNSFIDGGTSSEYFGYLFVSEPSVYTQCGQFLGWLRNEYFLKTASAGLIVNRKIRV
jgi:hypothetical protein